MITTLLATLAITRTQGLSGTWKYQAFDPKLHLIASGKITLQPELTPQPNMYTGKKSIKQFASESKVGPHASDPQRVSGQLLDGSKVSIDLNSGMKDNNIWLSGKLTGNSIKGTWGHSTFAGVREKGTFTLIRAK